MIASDIVSLNVPVETVARIEDKIVDEIPIRLYYPADAVKDAPIRYNIHGGALIAGDLSTHENISRKLANRTKSIVVAIDYRKAPEHPFPKSLDDVEKVYRWILSHRAEIGSSARKISLVSDSGGCLFAAALQIKSAKDKSGSEIEKSVYINPAFDLRNPGEGFYGLVTSWYLSGADSNDELVSPIMARDLLSPKPSCSSTGILSMKKPGQPQMVRLCLFQHDP